VKGGGRGGVVPHHKRAERELNEEIEEGEVEGDDVCEEENENEQGETAGQCVSLVDNATCCRLNQMNHTTVKQSNASAPH
jgi:hypothetical protein